jgi:hypothetical protein
MSSSLVRKINWNSLEVKAYVTHWCKTLAPHRPHIQRWEVEDALLLCRCPDPRLRVFAMGERTRWPQYVVACAFCSAYAKGK